MITECYMKSNYSYNMPNTIDNTMYSKEKKVKYSEVSKKKGIRRKQQKKESDRLDREKSSHSGRLLNRVKARHSFVSMSVNGDDEEPFELEPELSLKNKPQPKAYGRLKRKPGHRRGCMDKELMVHLYVMDDDFTEGVRVQLTTENGDMKKPFEGVAEDPFQYSGILNPSGKKVFQKVATEEPEERARLIPGTICVDKEGEPIDYFSLVG